MTTYNGNVLSSGTLNVSATDTASNVTVNAGGTEKVFAGGVASFIFVDGGVEVVSSGGTVISSMVQNSTLFQVGSAGVEYVYPGGTAAAPQRSIGERFRSLAARPSTTC